MNFRSLKSIHAATIPRATGCTVLKFLFFSVEETENFTTDMLSSGLLVVHDTLVGSQNNKTELSRGEDLVNKVLEVLELEVETGRDNTALVKTSVELNNNFAISSIIDNFELVDVTVLLHDTEELDQSLGDGSQDNLS